MYNGYRAFKLLLLFSIFDAVNTINKHETTVYTVLSTRERHYFPLKLENESIYLLQVPFIQRNAHKNFTNSLIAFCGCCSNANKFQENAEIFPDRNQFE